MSLPTPADALFIGPHPDDVELFCGGIVASLTAANHRVVIVDLSAGERASNGTPAERAAEAEAAAQVLGVASRVNLGLPDTALGLDVERHATALMLAIRRFRPRIVVAPAAIDRHPDHTAAHTLTERAIFLAGLRRIDDPEGLAPHRPDSVFHYPQHTHHRPDICVDTSAHASTKARALDCFSSQLSTMTGAQTVLNRPDYRATVEVRDRFHGALVGTSHAEPLLVAVPIATSDLMALAPHFHTPSPWRWPR
jgi:bacillithiol biosynthesis deacetylase BshB1